MITNQEHIRYKQILKDADRNESLLSPWEQDFVGDMVDRFEEYGEDITLSRKQKDALERIEDKLY